MHFSPVSTVSSSLPPKQQTSRSRESTSDFFFSLVFHVSNISPSAGLEGAVVQLFPWCFFKFYNERLATCCVNGLT